MPEYQVDPYRLLDDDLKDVYSYINNVSIFFIPVPKENRNFTRNRKKSSGRIVVDFRGLNEPTIFKIFN